MSNHVIVDREDAPEWSIENIIETGDTLMVCGECQRVLPPETKVEVAVECWRGTVSVHFTCTGCVELRERFLGDGWFHEEVIDDIVDKLSREDADNACCFDGLHDEAIEVVDKRVLPRLWDNEKKTT